MAIIPGIVSSSTKSTPLAPTIGTASDTGSTRAFNNGLATVPFTAPVFDGKLPITGYTVTSSPGSFTGTGTTSPITVAGLQSATAYTFTITATTAVGPGSVSSASNSITATTKPAAPTIGTATAGNASASVTFTAPATGGSAITGYTVTSSGGQTGTGASSPITVTGLTNGTAYTFTVTATNVNGISLASSASNSVSPVAPFAFTFNFFSFTPFTFSPPFSFFSFFGFSFGFTPPFGFSPPFYFSGPIKGLYGVRCVSADTFVRLGTGTGTLVNDPETGLDVLIDEDGKIVAKKAKDIQIGDEVLSAIYSEIDPSSPDYAVFSWSSPELTFEGHTSTTIVDIDESIKTQTLYLNGDMSAQFTAEHPILVKMTDSSNNEIWQFAMISEINEGDTILKYNPETNIYDEIIVETIDVLMEQQSVYIFSAEPQDLIVAGDIMTHNK